MTFEQEIEVRSKTGRTLVFTVASSRWGEFVQTWRIKRFNRANYLHGDGYPDRMPGVGPLTRMRKRWSG